MDPVEMGARARRALTSGLQVLDCARSESPLATVSDEISPRKASVTALIAPMHMIGDGLAARNAVSRKRLPPETSIC
jgi:hypothetical protein